MTPSLIRITSYNVCYTKLLRQAIDAPIWLLDEAFDDLDQKWRDQLKAMIQNEKKTVLVLASRYLEEFNDLFDSVLLLDEKKVLQASVSNVLSQFAHLCGDVV